MASGPLRIPRQIHDEIVAHAREDAPNECCGVLGGANGDIAALRRVPNLYASPLRYGIEPMDLYRASEDLDEQGQPLVGFYHSHLKSEAYPSQTDVNWANPWPEFVHLICSLAGAEPVVRAFSIRENRIEEVPLRVEG